MVPYRIDVHHHIVPPEYRGAVATVGVSDGLGVPLPEWSVDEVLKMMDHTGIRAAVVSYPVVPKIEDVTFVGRLARACNEGAAKLVCDYPQRFGAFAVMPLPDVDGTLNEIEYALSFLGLEGVQLLTNYDGRYLGDNSFEEVYKELDRRKAVVHVHPCDPPGNPFGIPSALLEAPFDTTRAITSLICSGTVERYPDISFVFSHAGGTIPFLADRIGRGVLRFWPGAEEKAPKGFHYYLKHLYYDTALSANPCSLLSIHALTDSSRILFGSDYPMAPLPVVVGNLKALAGFDGFDTEEKRAIEQQNALALFPGLKDRMGR